MSCCPKRAVTIQTAHTRTRTEMCCCGLCGCCRSYKGKGSHSRIPTAPTPKCPNHHVFKRQRDSFIFNSFIFSLLCNQRNQMTTKHQQQFHYCATTDWEKTFLFPITPLKSLQPGCRQISQRCCCLKFRDQATFFTALHLKSQRKRRKLSTKIQADPSTTK